MSARPASRWPAWLRRWPLGPYAVPYLLLLGLLVALLPPAGYPADVWLWVRWAQYSRAEGLGNVYALHGNNYNPLYHYVLWAFGHVAGSAAAIQRHWHWLKLGTLVFDVAGALLAASLARTDRQRFLASLLLLLNPAYLYNTLIWGQVDAVYTGFVFGAAWLALRGQLTWSAVCFVLALNAKLQALIFLPPLLLLWLPPAVAAPRRLPLMAAAAAITQVLVLLPFVVGGARSYLPEILRINRQAVGYYPYLSMKAFNWWQLLAGGDPALQLDTVLWHGLSYRRWGMLLFGLAAAVVLWPLLLHTLRRLRYHAAPDAALVLLSLVLVSLIFCFFNTQMHERYWHSALLFAGAYAFVSGRYALLALCSGAYLLNLEAVMNYLQLPLPVVLPKLVAVLFGLSIGIGIGQLYGRGRQLAANGGTQPQNGV